MPLEYALDADNQVRRWIEFQGSQRPYYEIMWQDRRIWGVTAAILVNLRKRLGLCRRVCPLWIGGSAPAWTGCSPASMLTTPRSAEHTSELQSLMRTSYASIG